MAAKPHPEHTTHMHTTHPRTRVSDARRAVMQGDAYWNHEGEIEEAYKRRDLEEVQRILIDAMEDAWTLGHGTRNEGEADR